MGLSTLLGLNVLSALFFLPGQMLTGSTMLNEGSRCFPKVNRIPTNQVQCVQIAMLKEQRLPSALVKAMINDLSQYRYGNDNFRGRIFFADLNNDRVNEAIVYPEIGHECDNRSCGVFIYTKVGKNYRKISADATGRYSAVAGSRNNPSVGILTTSNRGWRNLAFRSFDYTTRKEKWVQVRYGSKGYTDSPIVEVSTPRTILNYNSGMAVDFNKIIAYGEE
jgi:hypothetical protein